jgi:hypothetical protein
MYTIVYTVRGDKDCGAYTIGNISLKRAREEAKKRAKSGTVHIFRGSAK